MQAVVDLDCKFLQIDAGHPGASHDSHVLRYPEKIKHYFRQSPVWGHFERGHAGQHTLILGDSGYPLRPWLINKYPNPTTAVQRTFNEALGKARSTIERSIRHFKSRFTINKTGYRLKLERVPSAIVACGVLHNLAKTLKMPDIEDDDDDDEDEEEDAFNFEGDQLWNNASERQIRQLGAARRDELAQRFLQ